MKTKDETEEVFKSRVPSKLGGGDVARKMEQDRIAALLKRRDELRLQRQQLQKG